MSLLVGGVGLIVIKLPLLPLGINGTGGLQLRPDHTRTPPVRTALDVLEQADLFIFISQAGLIHSFSFLFLHDDRAWPKQAFFGHSVDKRMTAPGARC